MMQTELSLLSALVVGFLGGVHCVGMCGGIVTALTFSLPQERQQRLVDIFPYQFAYNLGRIFSYVIAGAVMGGLGVLLAKLIPLYYAQRVLYGLAGFFMILLGLYLAGWWLGLSQLERLGGLIWQRLAPVGKRLLPVRTWRQAVILGLVWGWVPCGLVYSMLIWAISAGSAGQGAALMLAFGLGTLPNLFGIGLIAGGMARWSRKPWVRQLAGALVICFGIYALWQVL